VYCTGPVTWSCCSAPGWSLPSPGQPVVSQALTPLMPEVSAACFGARSVVVAPAGDEGMTC